LPEVVGVGDSRKRRENLGDHRWSVGQAVIMGKKLWRWERPEKKRQRLQRTTWEAGRTTANCGKKVAKKKKKVKRSMLGDGNRDKKKPSSAQQANPARKAWLRVSKEREERQKKQSRKKGWRLNKTPRQADRLQRLKPKQQKTPGNAR